MAAHILCWQKVPSLFLCISACHCFQVTAAGILENILWTFWAFNPRTGYKQAGLSQWIMFLASQVTFWDGKGSSPLLLLSLWSNCYFSSSFVLEQFSFSTFSPSSIILYPSIIKRPTEQQWSRRPKLARELQLDFLCDGVWFVSLSFCNQVNGWAGRQNLWEGMSTPCLPLLGTERRGKAKSRCNCWSRGTLPNGNVNYAISHWDPFSHCLNS